MSLSPKESNAATWLRVSAMCSIVACHFFQAYGVYHLSSVFNVGVQIFFLLSGFLYAGKAITNWTDWWKRRWLKLYIPYLLCLCLSLCYLSFICSKSCSMVAMGAHLLNLQGFRLVFSINSFLIQGLQHFWFMTAIMISYIILMFMQRFYPPPQYIELNAKGLPILFTTLALLAVTYAVLPGEYLFALEWLWLFVFGYAYARIPANLRYLVALLSSAVLLFCIWRIYDDASILLSNFNRCNRVFHCSLGISLFCAALYACTARFPKWISCLDSYSYEIYLTHFVLLIGPGSLLGITSCYVTDITLILLISTIMALFLKYFSRTVARIFQKRFPV